MVSMVVLEFWYSYVLSMGHVHITYYNNKTCYVTLPRPCTFGLPSPLGIIVQPAATHLLTMVLYKNKHMILNLMLIPIPTLSWGMRQWTPPLSKALLNIQCTAVASALNCGSHPGCFTRLLFPILLPHLTAVSERQQQRTLISLMSLLSSWLSGSRKLAFTFRSWGGGEVSH